MKRIGLAALFCVLGLSCVDTRRAAVTFGDEGEGLDGFMCKDTTGQFLLGRLEAGGETRPASLVVDFVRLGGVPGCRTGQLVTWCRTHDCRPIQTTRSCTELELPAQTAGMEREELRGLLRDRVRTLSGKSILAAAPDEFVMVRVVASAQPCDALLPKAGGALPAFDEEQLVGCAYSCPVLLERVEQDVYLGFDTLTGVCEQGVRTCSHDALHWQP